MIPFNIPPFIGSEFDYIQQAIESHKISGDGLFCKRCMAWMESNFSARRVLLTTSCTSALDMAVLLCDIKPGDEVLLPSFTFSSTATAIVSAGGVPVFVDIRPDTMNIDETKIEEAITNNTKAIIVVHYAGVSCEMNSILEIAHKYHLKVIEDAAQGVMSQYKGKFLGTIGDFGCYSFHETKNYSMGEGGALVVNDFKSISRAEILREKGTNRTQFHRGEVSKYTWVDRGDSFLPSELNAAYLWAQLEQADIIQQFRLACWTRYVDELKPLEEDGKLQLPFIPEGCEHNAHLFYIKLKNQEERTAFIDFLKHNGISTAFHYIPLHTSPAGLKFGRFHGCEEFTTKESNRLVRLPLYYGLTASDQTCVIRTVKAFFQ